MSLYTIPPPLKMELSCVLESKSSDNCSLINVLVTIVGWGTAFALIGYWLFTTEGNWLWKCEYWWDFNENDGDLSPSDSGGRKEWWRGSGFECPTNSLTTCLAKCGNS